MIQLRPYVDADAREVGILIADTYGEYNLSFVPPEERGPYLGPFQYARSEDPAHRQAIVDVLCAPMVFVAVDGGEQIVGVLRGSNERLHSLFVRGDCHGQGIGRLLVERFEQGCLQQGGKVVRLASSLYAVAFYQKLGYRRSTGVRRGWSFDGEGFSWQPMKKVL